MAAGPGDAAFAFDAARFKDAMSRFATGVSIVSGIDEGQPVGFTCQSFVSLSIDPPYVAVAYLPDHQAPLDRTTVAEPVLDLCRDVDLLIHDAQYTEDEFVELFDWGHSTPAYAVLVATRSGAKRLDMFHHDPGHTDRQVDAMLRAARKVAATMGKVEVSAAKEGASFELKGS